MDTDGGGYELGSGTFPMIRVHLCLSVVSLLNLVSFEYFAGNIFLKP